MSPRRSLHLHPCAGLAATDAAFYVAEPHLAQSKELTAAVPARILAPMRVGWLAWKVVRDSFGATEGKGRIPVFLAWPSSLER